MRFFTFERNCTMNYNLGIVFNSLLKSINTFLLLQLFFIYLSSKCYIRFQIDRICESIFVCDEMTTVLSEFKQKRKISNLFKTNRTSSPQLSTGSPRSRWRVANAARIASPHESAGRSVMRYASADERRARRTRTVTGKRSGVTPVLRRWLPNCSNNSRSLSARPLSNRAHDASQRAASCATRCDKSSPLSKNTIVWTKQKIGEK